MKALGHRGLVISDDLEMGALDTLGTMPERARMALDAGHDVVLICHTLEHIIATVDALERALVDEPAFAHRFAQHWDRIGARKHA